MGQFIKENLKGIRDVVEAHKFGWMDPYMKGI
jgi:hypothetical protein